MRVHLQVDGAPQKVSDSARQVVELGADGLFTFEGPHDVFFPLVVAARETGLELMTNVAIAGPRSPVHMAHAAYDLQVLQRGPVPARPWLPDQGAHREAVQQPVG